MPDSPSDVVRRYHDRTKHAFHRFSPSLGYLDWASQPKPFRSYSNVARHPLYPAPGGPVGDYEPQACSYGSLFLPAEATPSFSCGLLGDLLRHAMGLSAWKQFRESRWSLRVNPSSGNLHPTETYLIAGPLPGICERPGVYHYAPESHTLERRCTFATEPWLRASERRRDVFLIALSSIHWRESWKYGERAFRYCQHDLGHAIAAIRLAAAAVGWRALLLPAWSHRCVASIAGLDRDSDFLEAEREEPACLLVLSGGDAPDSFRRAGSGLVGAVQRGDWFGRATRLSENHVEWTVIDDVARATADAGREVRGAMPNVKCFSRAAADHGSADADLERLSLQPARSVIVRRRSAVAFDGKGALDRSVFLAMLDRLVPTPGAPWDALWWAPTIHLAIFVHRVSELPPGLYALARTPSGHGELRAAMRSDFLWEQVDPQRPLWLLAGGNCRSLARRLSCDQDIAADGCFSLGMIAAFDRALDVWGPSFYRQLYWEAGLIGHLLYLEAEVAGVRGTGIGCFYDDPVHDVLGLTGHRFQSLYHFAVGAPIDDDRLESRPAYEWELRREGGVR